MASVIDETGNEHTGTEVGSPTYSAGAIGAAISLDGVADHLTTPDATDLNLTAFTYMAWIKTSNVAAMPIYSNWSSINPVRQGSIFKINTTGEIRGVVAGGGWGGEGEADGYAHVIGSNNLCDGKWHHVAFTYDGLVLRVFERGYEVASRDYVKTIPYGSECAAAVGCQYNDGVTPAQYFTGDIDDARIYRKALSEAEIQEIIAGVILSFEDSVLQALPAWYWQLDETSGIIAEEKKLGVDNLEYESDASTNSYAVTASQNDGRGTAKSLSGNAPPTDMLAHWQMNNEGGGQATIIDSTANGYDVPTGGSPTVGGVAGVINEATYLNGAQVGVLTSHVPFDVTNITIGAWVKTTDTGIQCIYSNYSNDLNAVSGVDFRIKSNVISLVIGSNTGMLLGTNYDLADGTTTVTDGNWHYVVGTYDGLYIKIYTDGVLEATEPYSGGLFYDLPNARMNIACRTDDFYFNRVNYLTGTLDEVVFFDRAITASEVFNLYNEPSTTTPTSLQIYDPVTIIATNPQNYWSFDQSSGKIIDVLDGNDITLRHNGSAATYGHTGQVNTCVEFPISAQSWGTVDDESAFKSRSFSVSCWLQPTTTSGNRGHPMSVWNQDSSNNFFGWCLQVLKSYTPTSNISFFVANGDTGASSISTSGYQYVDGEFHHVVGTYDDDTNVMALYVDNALIGSKVVSPIDYTGTIVGIGNRSYLGELQETATVMYEGFHDEMKYWSRAITSAEVSSIYTADGGI